MKRAYYSQALGYVLNYGLHPRYGQDDLTSSPYKPLVYTVINLYKIIAKK